MTHRSRTPLRLAILLPALALGCGGGGGDGPPRFKAYGEITLGGERPPVGEIMFLPDTAKGNSGPGTRAKVENGTFSLPSGKGHVGGPHRLKITLYDGTGDPSSMTPYGQLLVGNYFVERDLPAESGELDLSLPPLEEIKAQLSAEDP